MSSSESKSGSGSLTPEGNAAIVVITSVIASVSPVASFLERRGVKVMTFTDLQLAIDAIRRQKPTAVLLSINFPHPRVELLPAVIQGNFEVDCIAFAETQDRKTTAKLTTCKARFTIASPISGQVVLLRLKQIRESARIEDDLEKRARSLGSDRSETEATIRISSGVKPTDREVILQKGRRLGGNTIFKDGRDIKRVKDAIESGRLESLSATEGGAGPAPGALSDTASPESDERVLRRCAREALADFCDTQRVCQDFLNEYSSAWVMKMKASRVNATFVIAIGPTSGGFGPKEMLRTLIASLFVALKAKGIDPSFENSRLIQVQDYIAVSDALLLSSFSAHSKQHGTDVSIAVFPQSKDAEDFEPEMRPTENGMLSVPVSSFRQNVTPGFNAFLFLPLNQKFVHYLRDGAPVASQTSSNLMSRGITHVLISKEDASAYSRYHALSHIFKKSGS